MAGGSSDVIDREECRNIQSQFLVSALFGFGFGVDKALSARSGHCRAMG